jgi:SAM-dependent methyltransferase
MGARPAHLSTEIAKGFQDEQVVAVYHHRPPYPAEAIELLLGFAQGGAVIDLGCGPGDLARRIAPHVERVDAVDFSEAMVARGKQLPGGDRANLHWQVGRAEEAELHPPYALATAGESLHWMDGDVVLPRLGTRLAIVDRDWGGSPVIVEAMLPLWQRYSSVKNFARYDLIEELTKRGLFTLEDERRCAPEPWRPTIEEYLDARHSQRGFSRPHMGEEAAAAFDTAVKEALDRLIASGDLTTAGDRLELEAGAKISWGTPSAAR